MSVNARCLPGARTDPRRGGADGLDEPDGRLVPAHRGPDQPDAHRRRQHLRRAGSAVRAARGDGRRASWASFRATARRCASFHSASAARCGWTIRTSTSPTTCATAPCRRRAATSSYGARPRGIFAQRLDRAKPLWEIWMLEGLSKSRWALLSKVHHCMVDGVSATDLMAVMFGSDPAPEADRPVGARLPSRAARSSSCARSRAGPSTRPSSCAPCVRRRAAPRASLAQAMRPPPRHDLGRARGAPARRLVSDRAGRSAPDLELGARVAWATSRRCGPRSAEPSTTSC